MRYSDALKAAYDDLEWKENSESESEPRYLSKQQLKILDSFRMYRSSINEVSLYKGIDIKYLDFFKKSFRGFFKYRPRGGTYHCQNNCRMEDAKTFAVYPRD